MRCCAVRPGPISLFTVLLYRRITTPLYHSSSRYTTLHHSTVPAVLLQLWSQDGQIQHTIECGGEIGSVLVVGEFVFCGFKVQSEGTDYGMLKAWNLGDGGEFVMQVRVFWFESGVTRHVETSCVFACTVLQWCMCALFRKVF